MRDPYLYAETNVLKNRFCVKENELLETIEAEYTSMRIKEITETPISGNFDFQHLCNLHYTIFQDMYDWAGQPRIINIEKAEPVLGGISIEYSEFQDINIMISSTLNKMNFTDWDNFSIDEKARLFSNQMAELWKVHPFREGNTRTIVTFCCDFSDNKLFPLDRNLLKDNSRYLRTALVAAAAYFSNNLGDKSNSEYLIRIVKDAMRMVSM